MPESDYRYWTAEDLRARRDDVPDTALSDVAVPDSALTDDVPGGAAPEVTGPAVVAVAEPAVPPLPLPRPPLEVVPDTVGHAVDGATALADEPVAPGDAGPDPFESLAEAHRSLESAIAQLNALEGRHAEDVPAPVPLRTVPPLDDSVESLVEDATRRRGGSPVIRPFADFVAEHAAEQAGGRSTEPVAAPRPAPVEVAAPQPPAPAAPVEVAPPLVEVAPPPVPAAAPPPIPVTPPAAAAPPVRPAGPGPLRPAASSPLRPAAPPPPPAQPEPQPAAPPAPAPVLAGVASYVPEPYVAPEPTGYAPAYRSGYGPAYRTGYSPQSAGFPVSRLPAPPARRPRRRAPLLVLSYLLVIGLAAYGAHRFWPKSKTPASPPAAAAVSGVPFTYAAGHFRARFHATPTTSVEKDVAAGVHFEAYSASDDLDVQTVGTADLSVSLPSSKYSTFLSAMVTGTQDPTITLVSQQATTFRGHPARLAEFGSRAGTGSVVSVLFVMWQPNRCYLILARSGSSFSDLENSFVALP